GGGGRTLHHGWLWCGHCRGRYWRRYPERSARSPGAGWKSHHARILGEPEDDHRCDELDLEGRQHQKLLAVFPACICLGRSVDDDYGASQVEAGRTDDNYEILAWRWCVWG